MNEEKHHHWSVSFKLCNTVFQVRTQWLKRLTFRGDTAQALVTAAGAALASRLNHQLGLQPDPPEEALPLTLPLIDGALLTRSIVRLLVGVAVLLAVRAVMKAVAIPLACRIFGVPSDDVRKARQHAPVELAYRFMVYGTVAYCCFFLVPLLFGFLGLSWRKSLRLILLLSVFYPSLTYTWPGLVKVHSCSHNQQTFGCKHIWCSWLWSFHQLHFHANLFHLFCLQILSNW